MLLNFKTMGIKTIKIRIQPIKTKNIKNDISSAI